MKESEVLEIKQRAEKATPAPWEYVVVGDSAGKRIVIGVAKGWTPKDIPDTDAEFIAHSRADVPRLCDSWLEQDQRIAALRGALALAEKGSRVGSESFAPYRPSYWYCIVCREGVRDEDEPIPHAPDCPFSLLNEDSGHAN